MQQTYMALMDHSQSFGHVSRIHELVIDHHPTVHGDEEYHTLANYGGQDGLVVMAKNVRICVR